MDDDFETDKPVKVKVYLLDKSNTWVELGQGYVEFHDQEILYVTKEQQTFVPYHKVEEVVRIDLSKVSGHSIENESILMLQFEELSYALSFNYLAYETIQRIYDWIHMRQIERYLPKHANLAYIAQEVTRNTKTITKLAVSIPDYLVRLKCVFLETEACEKDSADKPNLKRLADIMKKLVNEPDEQLLLILVGDEIFEFTLGALQYSQPAGKRRPLREEFSTVKFNNFLDLPDDIVEAFVKPNMRIHFLRDCVVSAFIQPLTQMKFTSICQTNTACILHNLVENPKYFVEFSKKFSSNISKGISWLQQLCLAMKTCKYELKISVWMELFKNNIYTLLQEAMEQVFPMNKQPCSEPTLIQRILEVMGYLATIERDCFEFYIISHPSFCTYCVYIIAEGTAGAKINLFSLMTTCLTAESGKEQPELISIIQTKFIKPAIQNCHNPQSFRLMADFLASIYSHHHLKVRRVIIETNLLKSLLQRLKDKKLLISTLRLLKVMIEKKDVHTYRYFINNHLFRNLQQVYRQNIKKSNLVQSAFRNFFHCVEKDMPVKLISYINTTFKLELTMQERQSIFEISSLRDLS